MIDALNASSADPRYVSAAIAIITKMSSMKEQPADFAHYRFIRTKFGKQEIPHEKILVTWAHHEGWNLLTKLGAKDEALKQKIDELKTATNVVDWATLLNVAGGKAPAGDVESDDSSSVGSTDSSDPVNFYSSVQDARALISEYHFHPSDSEKMRRAINRMSEKHATLAEQASDDSACADSYNRGLDVAVDNGDAFLVAQNTALVEKLDVARDDIDHWRNEYEQAEQRIETERLIANEKIHRLDHDYMELVRYKAVGGDVIDKYTAMINQNELDVMERYRVKYLTAQLDSTRKEVMKLVDDVHRAKTITQQKKQISELTKVHDKRKGETQVYDVVNAIWETRQHEAMAALRRLEEDAMKAMKFRVGQGRFMTTGEFPLSEGPTDPKEAIQHRISSTASLSDRISRWRTTTAVKARLVIARTSPRAPQPWATMVPKATLCQSTTATRMRIF